MKICLKCKEEKSLEEFHKNSAAKDGLKTRCKLCRKTYTRSYIYDPAKRKVQSSKYYQNNKESVKARMREHYQNNKAMYFAKSAERRAAKRSQTPELTALEKDDIVFLYQLSREMSEEDGSPWHVDHIRPVSKGGQHHPNNLQLLSASENLSKGANW